MDAQASNIIDLIAYRERRRAAAAAEPAVTTPQTTWPMMVMMPLVWMPCWISMGGSVPMLRRADG